MVKKLEQSQRETNHKIKMIRQQQRRMADKLSDKVDVVDFASVPDEGDGKSANDIREELDSLAEKVNEEHKRLESLLSGCGRGRGKSPEFEFAARSILATGCSARAAKDNLLVGARLFLPQDKYDKFESEVPGERWFRAQRKGLGYEAWLHSMIRLAKCESVLQWGLMKPGWLLIFSLVDVMEPVPGGRWDAALAAERSAWRQANGLASGPS